VLCGDWNCPSGTSVERCLIGSPDQRRGVACTTQFESAYAHHPPLYTAQDFAKRWNVKHIGLPGPPPGGWMDVFDYIYYSSSSLCVHESWREPSFEDTMVGDLGIPCIQYPSDHVAMACTLAWADEYAGDGAIGDGAEASRLP